ncbi:MAG: UDP-N-acetylglucosamine 1-carboxyvinyltransferase [Aeromicrobium sp.]|jgi:UDP-N-acetylglucosamine 1-carboxyvinyltransferase|nr:UDP-N-acetylglucosamine 1-carboxyvinyltransferase [Aeromicrobium sp.]
MSTILVNGGRVLTGTARVSGAKNSALKLMAAALLAPGASVIRNVPDITDVAVMADVLRHLGATVTRHGHTLTIDATGVADVEAPYELVAQMRASIVVLGPLVARFGRARVAMPGGCNIGSRKIDMHVSGLERLGAEIAFEHGFIEATAPSGLTGADVILDFPSVGATENLLMAAVLARGTTVIDNAAREPEIGDLVDMLVAMGARIEGRGTATLTVEGVEALAPAEHATIGDRIEAGTLLAAGAITGGEVTVTGFEPMHLEMVLAKMVRAGCAFEILPDGATVRRTGPLGAVDVATLPFPGFPTDMQAQFMAMMAIADGSCVITENVFENRFMFADELKRMGADIDIEGHRAIVRGVERLEGAPVRSPDLRGGAALVLAGLAAEGETRVTDIHHILRGYEGLTGKLAALGADVRIAED